MLFRCGDTSLFWRSDGYNLELASCRIRKQPTLGRSRRKPKAPWTLAGMLCRCGATSLLFASGARFLPVQKATLGRSHRKPKAASGLSLACCRQCAKLYNIYTYTQLYIYIHSCGKPITEWGYHGR